LEKYVTLKDSIQSKQFLLRIYNSKKEAEDARKESRIGLLNRDNQIKKQQLKQEGTFRNFLIAIFIALVFAALYIFRNINLKRNNERLKQEQKEQEWKLKELESENKHVELQKQSAELEMQALRAQMNPHFIFNCLSSINHFILKNESKVASNYLTRFSRLMRMVLMNSQKPLIALDDELEMLGIYLEMERLRFKNSFDYAITFLNAIDSDNVFIPPLLLQPFCENAIWHGLMHKEGQGRLDIELSMQDNILNCIITDNGVGREKADEMNSKTAEKEKSMGLKITTERLALLNREKGLHTFYAIEDLKDEGGSAAGTKIILKINFKNSVEEFV
jgi:sensor histidine kinase YesM